MLQSCFNGLTANRIQFEKKNTIASRYCEYYYDGISIKNDTWNNLI